MLTIALDAMGGDAAPSSEIEGALQALEDFPISILLAGPEVRLRQEVRRFAGSIPRNLHFLDAPSVIEMDEPVAQALRRKRRSSIHVGMRAVQEGLAAAFVSAGNTGAVMALAKLVLRTPPSIDRPALAAVLPTLTGKRTVLLDVGANAECKAFHLVQFAVMGDIYSRSLLGTRQPKVGLISIGEEEAKGNDLTRETYKLLEHSSLNFIGNVEGRDICTGETDVIVCDGFTGNVVLKTSEGILEMLLKVLKQEMTKSLRTQVGGMLSRPAFQRLKKRFDYAEFGGAPLLGVRHTCIICHGRSNPRAIRNALRTAKEMSENRVCERIEQEVAGIAPVALASAR